MRRCPQSPQASTWPPSAAGLDRRHDLELADTQVTTLLVPPARAVGAEDIRHLQHERALGGSGALQGTDHLAQGLCRHLRIQRRGLELLVPEQHLDHPDVDFLLQQVGGEAVALMPRSA